MHTSHPFRQHSPVTRWALPLASALLAVAMPASTLAAEPGPHVHGAAELRVAVDANQLEISLESPLDSLLGFEHAPRTDKQRAAVRSMAAKLRQAQTLFLPTAAAQCKLVSVTLASGALSPELLGEPKPAKPEAGKPEDGHADLDATFVFTCAAAAQLKGMEVALMTAFSGMRKLSVQVVSAKGQSATLLVPGKRSVNW